MADPMQDPSADPSEGSPADASEDQGGEFAVVITSNGDGTYSVAVQESDDADDAGDSSGGDSSDGPQTASSIEEALHIAGTMLEQEEQEEGAEPADGSDDAPQAADKAKSYWNQMAAKGDKKRQAM